MKRTEAPALAAGSLALAGLGLFVLLRLRVTSDITHFLPGGRLDGEVRIARALAAGESSRTMVLLVEADDEAAAVRGARALEAELRAEPRVGPELDFLDAGPPAGFEEALWRLYEPHRLAFFADDEAGVAEATSTEALRAAAARLKRQLALPVSGLVSRVAPADPTLVLPRLLERLAGGQGSSLDVRDGRFVTESGAAVLFLGTRAPSSDTRVQRPLLEGIRAAFARVAPVDRGSEGPLELSLSGANRFVVRSEEAIRADVRRVSLGSTLGLALLFLVLYRSLRLAALVLPVVAAGLLAGTSACLLAFGAVHGLTLAFGAAMIGVSVDYAVHVHGHHLLAPDPEGPRHTLARLWPGLVLSAATTVVGFLALALSEMPGLRELALFPVAGIPAALLATRVFLPGLIGRPRPTPALSWLAARLSRTPRSRLGTWGPAAVALALAAFGLPRARWNDAIGELNRLAPELLREDERVRSEVARFDTRRVVVAVGADEEEALRANDRVAAVLAEAQGDGLLGGWRSLATLLPSAERQRAVAAAVRGAEGLWPRLAEALAAEGFRLEPFGAFREALAAPAPEPLTLADLESSPLAGLVRPFRLSVGEDTGLVSLVHDLADEAALRARLAPVGGAQLVDLEATLSGAYGAYRRQMGRLLLLGLASVVGLVALRHRAWRPTLAACLPAVLAAAGTLGALALAGIELNLLSLVALLLVVGMGVDYGVLLAETRGDERAHAATRLSVFVAGASTILGFGLLVFSDQPALFQIGATTALGVFACLLLAPTLAALAAPRPT